MAGRRFAWIFYIIFALVLYAADVASKRFVIAFGGGVSLNSGISFWLLGGDGKTAALVMSAAICAALSAAFVWALHESRRSLMRAPLALLAAGAAGNLTDRVVYGHVVEWLPVTAPFFGKLWINAADVWLIIGAGLAVLALLTAGVANKG